MLAENLLKRFVKDYNLPIVMFDEERFNYFIDLYDPLYKTKEKFELLTDTVSALGGEHQFFKYATELQNKVIEHIKYKDEYNQFIASNMMNYTPVNKFQENSLYTQNNVESKFISLDLIKANFWALRYYSDQLVDCCKSYDEFISLFTHYDYFIKSKQIRQVIFGNLNPKRQQTIQKYLMSQIADEIIKNKIGIEWFGVTTELYSVSTDEVLIKLSGGITSYYDELMKDFGSSRIRNTIFTLERLEPYNYYVKKSATDVDFKCVPSHFFAQCYKHYNNMEISKYDLEFIFEGHLASFSKPIFDK